jgi:hypothetical protein
MVRRRGEVKEEATEQRWRLFEIIDIDIDVDVDVSNLSCWPKFGLIAVHTSPVLPTPREMARTPRAAVLVQPTLHHKACVLRLCFPPWRQTISRAEFLNLPHWRDK